MKLTEIYKSETGENAIYRKGVSDYHTLKYVNWLEDRLASQQATGRDEAWFCSTCKSDENHGKSCDSCGEPRR